MNNLIKIGTAYEQKAKEKENIIRPQQNIFIQCNIFININKQLNLMF